MEITTVDKLRKVEYAAVDFTTGLTDLVLTVRKPDGSTITPAVTEQGDGVYTSEYTPDVTGLWQERFVSATNGDKAYRNVTVRAYDVEDVKAQGDVVAGKVDAVDTKVDAVDTKVTAVDGKVDTVDSKVDAVGTGVAAVGADVATVGGKVDAVDTKVDGVQTSLNSVDGKVDTVSSKIDALDAETKPGGYFL